MKLIKEKKIYTGDGVIENGYIRFGEKIKEIGDMAGFEPKGDDLEVECAGTIVVPGFIDIHSHGGYGKDNMDATPDEINEMVKQMTKKEGITTYFCTTMTQTYENIEKAMQNIHDAAQKNPVIKGIHVEGPFISTVFKGAQDPSYIKKPDENTLAKWNEISGGLIRIVTYAPEEADPSFETWCKENGVVLSAGHSNALYGELNASGATHVTHLYNAQRGLNHREPGVTGYGMLAEGVHAELICDGKHIVPDMVKLACKVRGYDGIELITDSMRAKGMPEGKSELGGQVVIVKDGMAKLEDGTIAGSILTYIQAFKNVMEFTGASVEEAVKMTSGNQAKEFGLDSKGAIAVGKDADMVVLNDAFELVQTISYGELA